MVSWLSFGRRPLSMGPGLLNFPVSAREPSVTPVGASLDSQRVPETHGALAPRSQVFPNGGADEAGEEVGR